MSEKPAVSYIENGSVATLVMHNPPVNALGKAVRVGLIEGMDKALANDGISAIVITSDIGFFSGGADISEFSTGDFEPNLSTKVLAKIEQSSKPVVAVLPGPAFGGGLELALACHYRITFKDNKVGLPEVHLGILPGAGGTQRLPRLIPVQQALNMIVSGKPEAASKLPSLFAVLTDRPEDLQSATAEFVQKLDTSAAIPRTCDLTVDPETYSDELFTQFTAGTEKAARGFFAPFNCIKAVKAATELPFDQGLAREGELFMECMKTPQARAQQHFFFAERAAGHVKDFDKQTPTRPIQRVAVIGAGTMGGGIAMNFANAGIPVLMLEMKQEALDKGLKVIRGNYERSAKKGKLSQEEVEARMSLLTGTTEYADLSDVDLVIEAVFEKLDVKQTVFKSLDAVCKPGAILATNTSTLDVNLIADATSRPEDVIGLHFFSPANVMKLLEIVKTTRTSPDVIKTCMQLAKTIKKVAVLVGVCFGFVGNRMIETYGREANRLMLEGARPEQVDKVIYKFGLPMGPFTMGDMAGLDIGYFVRQSRKAFIEHDPSYCVVANKLVEDGRVGLKVGKGVYLYEEGSRQPIPDETVMELAKQEAARLGIEQREISEQEIIERCIYPLINEGALILEEGIAAKASDIDVIYVYGYGFPVYRGGPMKYADEIGLETVLSAMKKYQDKLGEYGKAWFQPAPLLEQLAAQGKTFN
ncbi:3-hydroxyacyl-CoA dehydrogenase NAD-binding domain-containing protein [Alteromonas flava]|uniref:3-hydroxyacyl-CoA dehydrogenase NAD-binding domain-containing protein n=1 Tax=Alteromonas flava TaxID=2048003 RepID=UPI000C293F56|nr:3-hydroxyacyl-CoA dehydrogenase NAD-binding domain-containing protein [Alteromonas flava]